MDKQKELLFSLTRKDFDIQTFCSGGPGGQNQNKLFTGVRIVHRASGAVGESREQRSQYSNKRVALQRLVLTTEFKLWVNRMVSEYNLGKTVEEVVDEMMKPENIKVQVKDDKQRWVDWEGESE